MEQLGAQDAMFLYVENDRVANHVGAFYIYDQSQVPGGIVTFKQVLRTLSSKLHLVPRYRQRVFKVPANLDHPYWVDDPNFDIEYHVRHLALPKPGDWRQLCILTSRLYDRPLDMSRPLWVLYVIEGLDNCEGLPPGSFAVVNKMHHAMIDGVSGTAMAMALHDPDPNTVPGQPEPWEPERQPNIVELLSRAQIKAMTQPFNWMSVLADAMPASARVSTALREENVKLPVSIGDVPKTRFNGKTSGHRVIEGASFALDDLKRIKNAVQGATINDVVLAIGGGAMRKYLIDKNELPDKPLITLSPISVRSSNDPSNPAAASAGGNAVTGMLVALATDVVDPLERLKTIHWNTLDSKELTNAIGARLLTDVSKFVPAVTMGLAARLSATLGLATQANQIVNTVITNVPGPQHPVYFCGARMVEQFSLGTIQDGLCLFHAVFSYNGRVTITAMSDRAVMPDPAFYRRCMEDAFEELLDAVEPGAAASDPSSTSEDPSRAGEDAKLKGKPKKQKKSKNKGKKKKKKENSKKKKKKNGKDSKKANGKKRAKKKGK